MRTDIGTNPLTHKRVPRIGLGCMGMSEFYGTPDDAESLRVLEGALDLGYRHFDTADMYGKGSNERLLGAFVRSLGRRRDEILIASKVGICRDVAGPGTIAIDSSPDYIRRACEASLRNLGVDCIDLYYLHRRNPAVPIEESVGAMARLRDEGKIAGIGLSEVSVDTLRKAVAVAPISALQSEYSLWTRDPESETLGACRELGVCFVAYSPIGRGFLSGELKLQTVQDPGDLRGKLPRFQPEAFAANAQLLAVVARIAAELGGSPAQVALAWVIAQAPEIHAIPGTRKMSHLRDNFASLQVTLSSEQVSALSAAFHSGAVTGARLPEALLRTTNT